ncbi:hypothetical protein MFLAVUS_010157 [Mucor flavus]|uniref:Secreted protein n=1 Tax=Mucor flavus TaxID=439312 RepID=A0ABP9ZC02_9FUNG
MHTSVLFLVAPTSIMVTFFSAKPLYSAGRDGGGGEDDGLPEGSLSVDGRRGGGLSLVGGGPPLIGDNAGTNIVGGAVNSVR